MKMTQMTLVLILHHTSDGNGSTPVPLVLTPSTNRMPGDPRCTQYSTAADMEMPPFGGCPRPSPSPMPLGEEAMQSALRMEAGTQRDF